MCSPRRGCACPRPTRPTTWRPCGNCVSSPTRAASGSGCSATPRTRSSSRNSPKARPRCRTALRRRGCQRRSSSRNGCKASGSTPRMPGSCGPRSRSRPPPRHRGAAMAGRTIVVDGERWEVAPAGRVTVYDRDQFGVVFEQGTGPERRRRFTRYAPVGSRSPDAALAELSERELVGLFRQSQPAWTAPEGEYPPADVARLAQAAGLAAIALTDHDTTGGVPEATRAGEALGVRVVSGCEFSVKAPWGELHMLAYFLPPGHARLEEFLTGTRTARHRRAEQIVDRLRR